MFLCPRLQTNTCRELQDTTIWHTARFISVQPRDRPSDGRLAVRSSARSHEGAEGSRASMGSSLYASSPSVWGRKNLVQFSTKRDQIYDRWPDPYRAWHQQLRPAFSYAALVSMKALQRLYHCKINVRGWHRLTVVLICRGIPPKLLLFDR